MEPWLAAPRAPPQRFLRRGPQQVLPHIGQAFGGRDHTTVMHADCKIRQQMAERRTLFNQIAELTKMIKTRDGKQ